MKRLVLILVFLISSVGLFAQADSSEFKKPDYEGIKGIISDPDSELYYPKLMARMKQCDTTLTLAEYRVLYYGCLYQPGFSMFAVPEREHELIKYYQNGPTSRKQYDKIIEIINQILEEDPFYIRGLNV